MKDKDIKLRLILSDYCTQNCIFCSSDFNKNCNLDMPLSHAINCIDYFKQNNGEIVCFSGGEPTAYSNLIQLIKYAKLKKLKVQVTTNGTLLHTFSNEELELVDILHVSLNSIDKDKYNLISKPTNNVSFEQKIANIEKLTTLSNKFLINTIFLENFPEEIPRIIDWAKNRDIPIQIMNDMLSDKDYFVKYTSFIKTVNNNDNVIRSRNTTNPNFSHCRTCEFKLNCASTRAIWCFPNGDISVCPYKKELAKKTNILEKQINNNYLFLKNN